MQKRVIGYIDGLAAESYTSRNNPTAATKATAKATATSTAKAAGEAKTAKAAGEAKTAKTRGGKSSFGRAVKFAVVCMLLVFSVFCAIGSADWIISQQVKFEGSSDSYFNFDEAALQAHINIKAGEATTQSQSARAQKAAKNTAGVSTAKAATNYSAKTSSASSLYAANDENAATYANDENAATYANESETSAQIGRATYNGAELEAFVVTSGIANAAGELPEEAIKSALTTKYVKLNSESDKLPEKIKDYFENATEGMPSAAGTYAIYVTINGFDGTVSGQKDLGFAVKIFTITPCPVAIAWSGQTLNGFTYDGTAHTDVTATATVNTTDSGNMVGAKANVTVGYDITRNGNAENEIKNAGGYTLTAKLTGDNAGNYTITSGETTKTASFTVAKAALTVTANNEQITYGDDTPSFSVSYSGFVNGETSSVLSGTVAFACEYSKGSDVRTYTITPSGLSSENYTITFKTGTLTVKPYGVKIEWSKTTVTYNGAAQSPAAEISNKIADLPAPELTLSPASATEAGTYTVTASLTGEHAGNYTITSGETTSFVIKKKAIEISITETTIAYGTAVPTKFDYKIDESSLEDKITVSFGTTCKGAVGTYDVTATISFKQGYESLKDNYSFEIDGSGKLKVTPALLTVKAKDLSIAYGSDKPSFELEYTGFVNNETSSVLSGTVTFACEYSKGSDVDTYEIMPSGLTAENYDITFKTGTLTVKQSNPTIEATHGSFKTSYVEGDIISITLKIKDYRGSVSDIGILSINNTTKNTISKKTTGTYTLSIYVLYNNGTPYNSNSEIDFVLQELISFSSLNNNYLSKDNTLTFGTVSVKPVSYNKSTSQYYGRFENAVTNANNKESIYLIPSNTVTITNTLTIKSGVTVYIPYEEELWDITSNKEIKSTSQIDTNENTVKTYRKSQLIFDNGADLVIENGATFYLGALAGVKGIFSYYTEITLSAKSHIDVSGNFYCYGYVKEQNPVISDLTKGNYKNEDDSERYINVNPSAYLKTVIAVYDLASGGTLYTLNNNNICPLNVFDFPSFQTYLKIQAGAKFDGMVRAIVGSGDEPTYVNENANLIRQNTSEDALFYLSSGYIAFEYKPYGTNLAFSNTSCPTFIYLDGDIKFGYLKFSVSGVNINTAKYFLPLSYKLNVYALANSDVSVNYKVKLMPGSLLQINEQAKLTITSSFAIHQQEQYYLTPSHGYTTGKSDATFINNGTLCLKDKGAIGGIIQTTQTTKDAALCDFSEVGSSAFSVTTNEGKENTSITYLSEGKFFDETSLSEVTAQFAANSIIHSYGTYNCWYGAMNKTATLTVTVKDLPGEGGTRVCGYTVYQADDMSGTNQLELTSTSMNSSSSFTLQIGKYFKVVENDAYEKKFISSPDDETFISNTWYYISGDYELEITANKGYKLKVTTESESGAGTTKYKLYTSTSQNGTYTEVDTYTTSFEINLKQGTWFKIEFTGGYNSNFKQVVVDYIEIKEGPPELSKFEFDTTTYELTANYNLFVYIKESSCLVEGTLITLADGTQKKVEDITENDTLLVFNHYTGKYDYAKVLFNDHVNQAKQNHKIINLYFSNNKVVKVVYEHGFFDLDENKYVYITENNYLDYVGHRFYSATWNGTTYTDKIVTLDRANITEEYVKVYSPVTEYHMNYFTEDMLSMPGGIEGIFNIFEYGEGLKFDEELMQKDIEQFGEFTYENFKDLVPESIYNSFQTRYFTVAIGKGNLTMDRIKYYIDRYGPLMT